MNNIDSSISQIKRQEILSPFAFQTSIIKTLEKAEKTLKNSFVNPLEEAEKTLKNSFVNPLEGIKKSLTSSFINPLEETQRSLTSSFINSLKEATRSLKSFLDYDAITFANAIKTALKFNFPKHHHKAIEKRFERLSNRIYRHKNNIESQILKEVSPDRKHKLELELARIIDLTWIFDEIKEIIINSLRSYIITYWKQLKKLQESQLTRHKLINHLSQIIIKKFKTNTPINFIKENRKYIKLLTSINNRNKDDGSSLYKLQHLTTISLVFSSYRQRRVKAKYLPSYLKNIPVNRFINVGENRHNEIRQYRAFIRQSKPRIL